MKIPQKSPITVENLFDILIPKSSSIESSSEATRKAMTSTTGPTHKGKYIHWDDLRHRPPPEGCSHKIWWAALKFKRQGMLVQVPLKDITGDNFKYAIPDPTLEYLRYIDMESGGSIHSESVLPHEYQRSSYVVKSLIEEAITSSQIEGAATTRRVAKQMIRSGRKPKTVGEKMILNNYLSMQYLIDIKNMVLSPKTILGLHRMITVDTLSSPDECGRIRGPEEYVHVVDFESGETLHAPPPSEQLEERMQALCDFANGVTPDYFVHPVIRSIIVHFWLAYDHPFVDGNGRCARALFYWSMLHNGYWLFEYISISRHIKKALSQYYRAFLHTETDENDLTYFTLYHLHLLKTVIDDVRAFVQKKSKEQRVIETSLEKMRHLNHRQRDLIRHALRNPGQEYTVRSHMMRQDVTHQTSRTDLYDLMKRGLLVGNLIGRTWSFYPVEDLENQLKGKQ